MCVFGYVQRTGGVGGDGEGGYGGGRGGGRVNGKSWLSSSSYFDTSDGAREEEEAAVSRRHVLRPFNFTRNIFSFFPFFWGGGSEMERVGGDEDE